MLTLKNNLSGDDLKEFLDAVVDRYNHPDFIESDPISVPHSFDKKQDIEIAGFFAAVLAWGRRKTIVSKTFELMELMDHSPFDFILNSNRRDWSHFENFKHRTFQPVDLLYFLEFLRHHYTSNKSLENAFIPPKSDFSAEESLNHFRRQFFALPFAPARTGKHIAAPERNSSCKRLNMFLRWMARKDDRGVDFGLWERIPQSKLCIPLDVHVDRVARKLGLLHRKQRDWKAVMELTKNLQALDPDDPVKYDFALFSISANERSINVV